MNFSLWIDCILLFICIMHVIKIAYLTKEVHRQWELIEYITKHMNWQFERMNSIERKVSNKMDSIKRGRKQEDGNLK